MVPLRSAGGDWLTSLSLVGLCRSRTRSLLRRLVLQTRTNSTHPGRCWSELLYGLATLGTSCACRTAAGAPNTHSEGAAAGLRGGSLDLFMLPGSRGPLGARELADMIPAVCGLKQGLCSCSLVKFQDFWCISSFLFCKILIENALILTTFYYFSHVHVACLMPSYHVSVPCTLVAWKVSNTQCFTTQNAQYTPYIQKSIPKFQRNKLK